MLETQEENSEAALHQEYETPVDVPPQKEKEDLDDDMAQPLVRKESVTNSEGPVTRSREKSCTEEAIDTSTKEQEPLSRKGRKSNKAIREHEATWEKAAGKQSNLEFLVKTSQASKYLLGAEEGKKQKEKALRQLQN